MNKLQQAAIAAKKDGYTHIYSIVKSVFNTTYVHINTVDEVIANGWEPAPYADFKWHGRVGVTATNLPTMSINKSDAIKKYVTK